MTESNIIRGDFSNKPSKPLRSTEMILRGEAEKKAFAYFFRPLTLEDLGANFDASLKGSFKQVYDEITVNIEYLTNTNHRPFVISTIVKNLMKTAQEKGATTLTIEGAIVDAQFKKYVRKNHRLAPEEHGFDPNKISILLDD